jgi:putative membrane protein
MIKMTGMKKCILYFILFFLAGYSILSCRPGQHDPISREVAKDVNNDKFDTKAEEKTAAFVVEEVSGNFAAIEMSKLLIERSDDNELKQIANGIEKDRTMFLNGLTRLAADKHITIPTEPGEIARNEIKELRDANPKGMEKPWCDKMIDDYKRMITKYEGASTKLSDPEIKEWTEKALPLLRTHLDKLMSVHYTIGNGQ